MKITADCQMKNPNIISLNGRWLMKGADKSDTPISLAVNVPCTVHTALAENNMLFSASKANKCKDTEPKDEMSRLFYSDNADKVTWIEDKEWVFEREFDLSITKDTKKIEIEFKGLDTYCEICLNGILVKKCKNMHMTHSIDITDYAIDGSNKISVRFLPPVKEDAKNPQRNYGGAFSGERFYTRRMQCTYGWDWVNRFVTMGIFDDVNIYVNRFVKIDCLKASLKGITPAGAVMELYIKGDHSKNFFDGAFKDSNYHFEISPTVCFTVEDPDGSTIYQTEMLFREAITKDYVTIENPKLWYPSGYGESPIYKLTAKVKDGDRIITQKTVNFGIREIAIVERFDKQDSKTYKTAKEMYKRLSKKEEGENEYASFELYVNKVKIICKGANWVPADPFPGNVSSQKYESLISLLKEGNMNMLRVWGGGIFEKDEFYDLCDRYGIMVQQDFLMACGTYPYCDEYTDISSPEEKEFVRNLKAETEQNVQRLVSHPSIVWWNGDNENQTVGNQNLINNARKISGEITAPILDKYDSERRFFYSSPWGGNFNNSPSKGLFHGTGYLDEYFDYIKNTDMRDYKRAFGGILSRFANETPILSCPSNTTVKKFLPKEDMTVNSFDGFVYHTKNHPDKKYKDFGLFHHMDMGAKKLFGDFKDGCDRIYKMGIFGYEWARTATEAMRMREDYATGLIFWMYNDCWPALGWSVVDWYGLPKGAYYGIKKAAASVCGSIEVKDGKTLVNISNDLTTPKDVKVKLTLVTDGDTVYQEESTISLAPCRKTCFVLNNGDKFSIKDGDTKSVVICDITGDGVFDRSVHGGVLPSCLKLPKADVKVSKRDDKLYVKSDKLAMFVWLDGEYVFSDNCMIIMPGEEKEITLKKAYINTSDKIDAYWLNN